METRVIDNYIDTINEAVNWVVLWTDSELRRSCFAANSISHGKELHCRVFNLSPYEIREEILKNSTIDNIEKCISFFAKRLESEGAAILFPFGFDDIVHDSNNEYHRAVFDLVRDKRITQTEGNDILRQIAFIVKEINFHTEQLQGMFAELKQSLTNPKKSTNALCKLTHFNSTDNEGDLTAIFERLRTSGYIAPETNLQSWLFICGLHLQQQEQIQIEWLKDQETLAYTVYSLFGNSDNRKLWEITSMCFRIKGKQPNKNTMKNKMSRLNNGWGDDAKKKFANLKSLLTI